MFLTVLVMLALVALYWFPTRRWMNRWGATPADLARLMAGDALLPGPTYSGTTAVTVNAAPEQIWPWLVQIGYQRGGLYSYDWLDRLFGYHDRPSATRILPEFQRLTVGDHIPLGRGPSWPVAVVEPKWRAGPRHAQHGWPGLGVAVWPVPDRRSTHPPDIAQPRSRTYGVGPIAHAHDRAGRISDDAPDAARRARARGSVLQHAHTTDSGESTSGRMNARQCLCELADMTGVKVRLGHRYTPDFREHRGLLSEQ